MKNQHTVGDTADSPGTTDTETQVSQGTAGTANSPDHADSPDLHAKKTHQKSRGTRRPSRHNRHSSFTSLTTHQTQKTLQTDKARAGAADANGTADITNSPESQGTVYLAPLSFDRFSTPNARNRVLSNRTLSFIACDMKDGRHIVSYFLSFVGLKRKYRQKMT